jgi:4-hydroxybenzoate polyprenyltransferase
MNKITAHIKIFRPLNLCIGAFAVIITASVLGKMDQVTTWLTALIVVVLYNAAANAINDYLDQETDRINRPNRPLITGLVKPNTILIISIILFTIGTLVALTLPFQSTIIAIAIAMPLMIFYNILFKRIPILGNFIISLILGLTFIFAGSALKDINTMIIPALLAFGLTMVRELVKDIADFEGDKMANLNTYPTAVGVKSAWFLTAILSLIIGIGAIVPYSTGIYNHWYIIFVIFGVEIPLAITVFYAMKNPTIMKAKHVSSLLKFSTIAGVFAVWLGSF